ncbi:ornithine carbamoyltransferase [Rubrobacter taiwanensis]|jgi:ornithine carbamoyltransferase|uniref:Ornithine carbamoyltransferase n=1 Tax=Rubrobacter taiwanensis TaxID=185139 RepID=A0A4R1BI71_9ACTN|nr:ornithine carbamoyltransferase [Rubrobacter taiwanensis]TCJ16897.1 ornithine carbamoyltransferase [Rubrobacter taiwanensis]
MISPLKYEPQPATSPLFGRDCLTLAEYTPEEVSLILDEAARLKSLRRAGAPFQPLRGKTLAMIFQKPSNRTRVSFETGMYQLGGHAIFLGPQELQMGVRETISDTGRTLARYTDAIMARVFGHEEVEELAAAAEVPVINGLSDTHHPCQALADLLTIREEFGSPEGVRVAFIGDGNNVAHSLMLGCALTGAEFAIAHPPGHAPSPEVVDLAHRLGGSPHLTEDPYEAAAGARAVYTDVWASMGQEDEAGERRKKFLPYQVDEELMSRAAPEAIFLHCLPAHREEEVTAGVIDGPQSRVFDQAENRLHAQKALLYLLLS